MSGRDIPGRLASLDCFYLKAINVASPWFCTSKCWRIQLLVTQSLWQWLIWFSHRLAFNNFNIVEISHRRIRKIPTNFKRNRVFWKNKRKKNEGRIKKTAYNFSIEIFYASLMILLLNLRYNIAYISIMIQYDVGFVCFNKNFLFVCQYDMKWVNWLACKLNGYNRFSKKKITLLSNLAINS